MAAGIEVNTYDCPFCEDVHFSTDNFCDLSGTPLARSASLQSYVDIRVYADGATQIEEMVLETMNVGVGMLHFDMAVDRTSREWLSLQPAAFSLAAGQRVRVYAAIALERWPEETSSRDAKITTRLTVGTTTVDTVETTVSVVVVRPAPEASLFHDDLPTQIIEVPVLETPPARRLTIRPSKKDPGSLSASQEVASNSKEDESHERPAAEPNKRLVVRPRAKPPASSDVSEHPRLVVKPRPRPE